MKKKIRVISLFLFVLVALVSCNKSYHVEKQKNENRVATNLVLKCDTLATGLFHTVFYKLLKKVYPDKQVNIFIKDDELVYTVNTDTLLTKFSLNSDLIDFFKYSRKENQKVFLYTILENPDSNFIIFISKRKRDMISEKDFQMEINRISSSFIELNSNNDDLINYKRLKRKRRQVFSFSIRKYYARHLLLISQ